MPSLDASLEVDRAVGVELRRRWYRVVRTKLGAADDRAVVQLEQVWNPDGDGSFVWIDRRMRLWRIDREGRARVAAHLGLAIAPPNARGAIRNRQEPTY